VNDIVRMLIQRLSLGALTLFIVSLIIFLGISLLPGDAAQSILGQSATPETVAALRKQMGLDLPAHVRYFSWLGGILRGDFGVSISSQREISGLIGTRFANTLFLALYAAIIAIPLALILGILAALYRNSWFDRSINVVTLSSISTPEFFVAYILILFMSVKFGWFPSLGNVTMDTPILERAHKVFLPALTLTLVVVAHMMRMTRAAIINLLASPYIEMAALKGMTKRRIITHHALPNAWAPIINVIVLNLAYLIVGVVVVEVVFVYPGLGQLLVDSVQRRDLLSDICYNLCAAQPDRGYFVDTDQPTTVASKMSQETPIQTADSVPPPPRRNQSKLSVAWRELRKAPISAKVGVIIILTYIFVAVFAPLIAPYGESDIVGDQFELWGEQFFLGTDNLGRDMLTRIIYGARNTVGIALIITLFAFLIGGFFGLLAAAVGGWVDQLLSRTADVLMAIPLLIFAMLLLTIFGTSVVNMVLIIGILDSTRVFRLTRAVSVNVVVMDFIESARLRGEGLGWITIREILPNILPPLSAEFGLRPLIPAAAIAVLTIGVNFVVDWFLHKSSGLKDEH